MDKTLQQQFEAILEAPSCYPERVRKSREKRLADLMYWYEKYNDVNIVYNLWGMDCEDASPLDEWLDRGVFRKQRHDVNAFFYPDGSRFPIDYTVIMRDKRMFESFAELVLGFGNMYSPSLGYIIEGDFYIKSSGRQVEPADFHEFIGNHNGEKLVFKHVFGCSGETVKVVTIKDGHVKCGDRLYSATEFFSTLSGTPASNWIIQEFILQHEQMNQLNETSVNTLRIVTYHIGSGVEVYPVVMMRYGVPGALVDNANLGVGVGSDGVVQEHTFSLVSKTRFKCHFAGRTIPYFDEAVSFAKMLHANIPEIFTVGWDICITPGGPHLIEGNDGWDVILHQAFDGCRMRNFYSTMLEKRMTYYKR